jgi:hypothetical protein
LREHTVLKNTIEESTGLILNDLRDHIEILIEKNLKDIITMSESLIEAEKQLAEE